MSRCADKDWRMMCRNNTSGQGCWRYRTQVDRRASKDTSVQNWLLRGAEQPLAWSSQVSQHGGVCGETPETKDTAVGMYRDTGLGRSLRYPELNLWDSISAEVSQFCLLVLVTEPLEAAAGAVSSLPGAWQRLLIGLYGSVSPTSSASTLGLH